MTSDHEFPPLKQLAIDLADALTESIKDDYDEIHDSVSEVSPSSYVHVERMNADGEYVSSARIRFSDHKDLNFDGETDTILIDASWTRKDMAQAIDLAKVMLASRTARQIREGL